MGWLVGLAVLLITLGVIAGLVGITIVARKKQRFRINESPSSPTNQIQPRSTNGAAWFPGQIIDGVGHPAAVGFQHSRAPQLRMAGAVPECTQGSHPDEPFLATLHRT